MKAAALNYRGTKPGQFFTPRWAAEALVERFFGDLGPGDGMVEPSCGPGGLLFGVPLDVPAVGVETDPALAADARANTGREIICGDFRSVPLPFAPTCIIGNPPFEKALVCQFLARAWEVLPWGGRVGFILPAYMVQRSSTVMEAFQSWSLRQEVLPKELFFSMEQTLIFLLFGKERVRVLVGFSLYAESNAVRRLSLAARVMLTKGRPHRSAWRALAEDALEKLGGAAALESIYQIVEGRRPSGNPWWKEQLRKVMQGPGFVRLERGMYALEGMA